MDSNGILGTHNIPLYGQASKVKKIYPALVDSPTWWAKAYVVELNTISHSNGGAVGSGYVYWKDYGNTIESDAIKYYYDPSGPSVEYFFTTVPGGQTFRTSVGYDSFDSTNNCHNWYMKTKQNDEELVCLEEFPWGYPRVWAYSSSDSHQFSTGTEFNGAEYLADPDDNKGTDWSDFPGSGQAYCWSESPFDMGQSGNLDTWDVVPPGTISGCSNNTGSKSWDLWG